MSLSAGTRFGAYEIVSSLGAGGMGEVYRAHDRKLGRDVAIKILPATFANDRERIARFEREARLLATLNHPNIAAIYGIEEYESSSAVPVSGLVLELVEGESLDVRLSRGPLALREALKIGQQIADALEAAHTQGIVHRDLKPANLRVTRAGNAKVLDFGLAKALDSVRAGLETGRGLSTSPTAAEPVGMTSSGVVVGTPAYMSPEQARGHHVDERTDLWALGCVLYEMLTARRAFGGSTATDVLAAIVNREPDWQALPAATPPAVRQLLRRCLAKDLRDRMHHAGDIRLALEDAQKIADTEPRVAERRGRTRMRIALGAITTLSFAVIALAALVFRPVKSIPEVRFETAGSGSITPNASIAISPDGRQVVVAPVFEGEAPLWLRPIDSIAGRTLAGTEGAFLPFWSPDGRSIAFFAHRKLHRVDLASGVTSTIADASVGRGGAWTSDGTIVFASNVSGPLSQVSAAGGAVSVLTKLEQGQNDHRAPQFLPGETHFLYYARGAPQVRGVYVARRDGSEPKRLIDADAPAVFAPSGQLLFVRDRTLFAQKFDPDRLEVSGPTVAIADSVALNQGVSLAMLAASPSGTVAYGTSAASQYQFAWFDRTGKRLSLVNPPNIAGGNPSLSPDGRSVALNRVIAGNWDIWVLNLQREALTRITSDPTLEFTPIWTPDGQNIVFESNSSEIRMKAGDGTGRQELLLSSPLPKGPTDISRDGRFLLLDVLSPTTSSDIWIMSMTGDRNPHPIVQTMSVEREGQFSPDGRWLAYSSNETGQFEVYVQPFPGPGPRVPVSLGGGNQLRWGRRGTELFYIDPRGRLTAVPITFKANQAIEAGKPVPLFATPFGFSSLGPRAGYVVSEDDQRFLLSAPIDPTAPASIVVMLNWRGEP
jgi:eukaryotic-like serine/threonine-protein kinase